MIRWDPARERIIVERPEQIVLYVLPSVCRQSRFPSFSRQFHVYGFMRTVNPRNMDRAIDGPDASTWSHPTLNRHSPPEVVANFKRHNNLEVSQIPPPRSVMDTGPGPFSLPPGDLPLYKGDRARALSAPGSFTPFSQPGAAGWGSYPRSTLPPLNYQYSDQQSSRSFSSSASNVHSTFFVQLNPTASNTSIANGYSSSPRPQPAVINTYTSSYAPLSRSHCNAGPLSPDSRPTSGYSASSMSTLPTPYEDQSAHFSHDYSRPGSGHHRPLSPSPSRPPSSKSYANGGFLSIRAMSLYLSPYSEHLSQRPSTSPHPAEDHAGSGAIPRVRSMIQLPSVDDYSLNPAHGDFAYANHSNGMYGVPGTRTARSSTSASSLRTTSSAANTPGADGYTNGAGDADITRYSTDCGFVQMNEHVPQYAKSEL
ncbi:hypothetical protein LXA43DRAFT_1114863 [Ganoderma leucocontextum]|nr:hypothetical protein LXA43DRAFT_1159743 [Ganoderma leucocontextum]KAI1794727.1 hypothetical protein LXA43DRAFT_1114863 [Ganoderma leucocontextum]